MKSLKLFVLFAFVFVFAAFPKAASCADLPNSGTYFIINALNDEALEPLGPTPGQNVFLGEYTKSGMQKWVITRKIDPKTKKPTNRYVIRLAGEATQLWLNPYPGANHTSILNSDPSVYVFQPEGEDVVINSVEKNGDSLFAVVVPSSRTEVQVGPKEESAKFRWKFVATEL